MSARYNVLPSAKYFGLVQYVIVHSFLLCLHISDHLMRCWTSRSQEVFADCRSRTNVDHGNSDTG